MRKRIYDLEPGAEGAPVSWKREWGRDERKKHPKGPERSVVPACLSAALFPTRYNLRTRFRSHRER